MPSQWYDSQPKNRNFLAPSGFKLNLEIFAGVDFFCQQVSIPGIDVPNAELPTRYRNIPVAASGGLRYEDLQVTFIVDEDLENYLTIWNWIQINNLGEHLDVKKDPEYSAAELLILNSNFQAKNIVGFEDLFPVSLSSLNFDVKDTEVDYLTATATFKFVRYYFNNNRI